MVGQWNKRRRVVRLTLVSSKIYRIGFVLHSLLMSVLIISASSGWLPRVDGLHIHADKVGHAFFFGLLAFFLNGALGFRGLWRGAPRWLPLGPIVVLLFAMTEEIAQLWLPCRTSSFGDFAADVVGVVLLSWLSRQVARPDVALSRQSRLAHH